MVSGSTHLALSTFWFVLAASLTSIGCAESGSEGDEVEVGTGGAAEATGGSVGDGDVGDGDGDIAGSGGSGYVFDPSRERVVGYIPTYRGLNPNAYDLTALTHLCIAFANPAAGAPGNVSFGVNDAHVQTLVTAAHERGVYVLASIAGAGGGEVVEAAIQPAVVDTFVAALVTLVDKFELDGIDVDIEGSHVNAFTYDPFVAKLKAALPAGKLVTAAVATWNGDDFPDTALQTFDFINLMSYDHCGTWSGACEHSNYEESIEELSYWENDRGVPAERMVLGVPFYGYCWGAACADTALTYASIIATYPEGRDSDYFSGDGYTISHNTAATISDKAVLAKEHGGIMIWELGQDAAGADSLLQVIKGHQE